MPKKKRSLIGYVRPKKRAISEEEEALEEPSIANDVEPIPEEVAPMPPEASLSAMSIADGGSNDAPPQESKKSMLSLLKADYHKTLRKRGGRAPPLVQDRPHALQRRARWRPLGDRERAAAHHRPAAEGRRRAPRGEAAVRRRSPRAGDLARIQEPLEGSGGSRIRHPRCGCRYRALMMANKFERHGIVRARHAYAMYSMINWGRGPP